jgi:hypothetical protein
MKKAPIILAFILIAGVMLVAQAQTAQTGTIKDADFSNFSYNATFGDAANRNTIKLSDGKLEEDGLLYELSGKPVYADLNGDKTEEAVVEIKVSGGSYRAFEVQIFTFQKSAAKMLARLDSNRVLKDYQKYYPKTSLHYAGINPPTVKNGIITVEALTEGSFACPKYTAVFNYKLVAGKFVLSGKPTRNNFKCNG